MTTWFDKLKNLVKIEIKDSFIIQINHNKTSEKVEYTPDKRTLYLNLAKLNPEELKTFKPILLQAVDDGQILLQDKSEELIEDFKSKESSKDVQSLLDYFKDKIPPEDHKVLRAALYLRERFRSERKNIYELKGDILKKYGKRGGVICNLCTAGYFETVLKPLYEEMKKDSDSKEKFLRIYEIIIKESAFAVFVNLGMSSDTVKTIIEEKIQTNLSYGQKFVNIHGIGPDNVKKIRDAITEIEEKSPDIRKTIEEKQNIIFVKLQF